MNFVLKIVLPVIVLAVGAISLKHLVDTRPQAIKRPTPERGALVEVLAAEVGHEAVVVSAQGSVVPAQRVVLQSEVAGRVVWQHEDLVPGGRLKQGELAVRIDSRDYDLALEQQAAAVEQAGLALRLERSRRQVAAREWEIIGEDALATEEGRQLALRGPQLDSAQANLAAAQSARRVAELAVSKTQIRVPFNAFVQSESVDRGQLVAPQTPLATLVGTDAVWVQVSLPLSDLSWLSVPGYNAAEGEGARAVVVQDLGEGEVQWQGRVVRLLGDLDPVGRLARLLVEVPDPLRLAPGAGQGPPLLVGAYVQVQLQGRSLQGVIELPRKALREGNRVYVAGPGDALDIRDVKVVWARDTVVWIAGGLQAGERVITSRLPVAVAGQALRIEPPPAAEARRRGPAKAGAP